ncbi:MAG: SAM-dependent methyltransferase [Deltaproteobacteria bacterium]|nr:SAM-dependent methyltransferase [Deltaproteobacteria bacterium]HCH61275.1 SAM-dependent methyltransferase [Deltaproteobacteria bacterium]
MANRSTPVAGAADRAPQVREMFDTLAPTYDRANRIISMGLDQGWRRKAIARLGPAAQGDMLDLCAGTLDLTVMLLDAGAARIHSLDFAQKMLDAGAPKLSSDAPVQLVTADAREMPLEDGSVDGIIAGFGLRNVPEVERAIDECSRVLRPGGRLVVLEFFQPTTLVSQFLSGTYNRFILPILGGVVSGYGGAYSYLAGSIDAFVTREAFGAIMEDRGFTDVRCEAMFPPVADIVSGTRSGGAA